MKKNKIQQRIDMIISLSDKKNFFSEFLLRRNLYWFLKNVQKKEVMQHLFFSSCKIRNEYCGKIIALRGLIEFSNYCKNECYYCGINCKNTNVNRYRLSKEEIMSCVDQIHSQKIKTVVLQSGDDEISKKMISPLIIEIKNKYPDMAITLSVGEQSFSQLEEWKKLGADRYLLRIEASNFFLYRKLHNKQSVFSRKKCLSYLEKLNYQTGCGMIVGTPFQKIRHIVDDLIYFKKNNFDMIGIGPFIPHPNTKFKDKKRGEVDLTLAIIALTRLILKKSWIPATTALGSLDKDYRIDAIKAGANVIMPNFSPAYSKCKYEIYPNKICNNENKKNALEILNYISNATHLSLSFDRNDKIE